MRKPPRATKGLREAYPAKRVFMSKNSVRKVPLVFYKTAAGNSPVREWLIAMPKADRHAIGRDLAAAQYGWPVGMPLCRPLGRGLFEIRTSLGDRIARVFVCIVDEQLVALHAIIKKTQTLPPDDLALARKRRKEVSS